MSRPGLRLRLATRGSPLARWQADRVATLLAARGVESSVVVVDTEGDRRPTIPLDRLGGRGVFVREVQTAVLRGDADAAVHSAKDLPASEELTVDGLTIAAFPERADPRDLLVGATLSALPPASTVATGSARRRAQLANLRPDLLFRNLRGNMATRLSRVGGEVTAVVVANAAVERLAWSSPTGVPTEALDPSVMLPQVAQGALAVECRADDATALEALAGIDDPGVRGPVEAERAFLAELGGGCTLPIGAHADWSQGHGHGPEGAEPGMALRLRAMVAAYDGRVVLRHAVRGSDPVSLGQEAARALMDGAGGRDLLEADE